MPEFRHLSSPDAYGIVHDAGGNFSATSPGFNPPDDSWIYLHIPIDSPDVAGNPSISSVSNTGTALTWTLVGSRINSVNGGAVFVYRAYNAVSQTGITVSLSGTGGATNASTRSDANVFVWTGCAASQASAAVATSVGTADPGAPSVTTTAKNSRVAGCAIDWNAGGAPVSKDIINPYHYAAFTSGGTAYKRYDTETPQSVSLDFNWAAAPIGTYVVYEILDGGPPRYGVDRPDLNMLAMPALGGFSMLNVRDW